MTTTYTVTQTTTNVAATTSALVSPVKTREMVLYVTAEERKEEFDFREPTEAILDRAVKKLGDVGVKLIEFRHLLYRRMNVPVYTVDYSYVVDDADFSLGSSTLALMGLPVAKHDSIHYKTSGAFVSEGVSHLLNPTEPYTPRHIILFPTSFVSFYPSELDFVDVPTHEYFTRVHISPSKYYVPRPPAVYACLLRLLVRTPRKDPTRTVIKSDLSLLVMYHLYKLDGFVDEDEEDVKAEDDPVIQEALNVVRQWTRDGEWRAGEEWMGDALGALVEGKGDYDYLPWNS